jgi:hypothetical protein
VRDLISARMRRLLPIASTPCFAPLEFRSSASNSNFTAGHADVNSLILCAMEIRASLQMGAVLGVIG